MKLYEYDEPPMVLMSAKEGTIVGHSWWLSPIAKLRETLEELGCSASQITDIYENLLSDKGTRLCVELPQQPAYRQRK